MKKFIIAVFALLCVACSDIKSVDKANSEETTSMFVSIEQGPCWNVLYHKDTKVMYVMSNYGEGKGVFTVLVDRDGKPLTWKGGVQ